MDKKMKKIKKIKEAKKIKLDSYIEGDLQVTKSVYKIDPNTDFVTTPWGTRVKADDVVKVLEEYYSLPEKDKESEKQAAAADEATPKKPKKQPAEGDEAAPKKRTSKKKEE